MRPSDGFAGGSGEYVTCVYEEVPQQISREIVDEFVAFKKGGLDRTTRKEFRLPSGRTETIVLDYETVVFISAFAEGETE